MDATQAPDQADGSATSTIGEVAYEDDAKRLILAVAGDLSNDGIASDILTDILVTAPEQAEAERQIHAVSERLGWAVSVDRNGGVDVVTLDPGGADTID